MGPINLYSPIALEPWDFTNCWEKGIGASEQTHQMLHEEWLSQGIISRSYAPLYPDKSDIYYEEKSWYRLDKIDANKPENYLIFRDPTFFDRDLHPEGNYLFIAQDTMYAFTEKQLDKVTKYICLSPAHADLTLATYPQLKGKIYLSSNGIRRGLIESIERQNIVRNPNKLFYASSPDRGLMLILQNWFRILERCPQAELYVAYGFENLIKMGESLKDWRIPYKEELESLMKQKGIHWLGRINQNEVLKHWFSTNVFWYPNTFFETSCVSLMEAQACGAVPVTNKFGALETNTLHGYLYEGTPDKDVMCKIQQVHKVCDLINDPSQITYREEMMIDARDSFDIKKMAKHYLGWMK